MGRRRGLATVSSGLPESAVCDTPDRPIALTLLRSFRRAVFSNDNPGGQIPGQHRFRYLIVPLKGDVPIHRLFSLGQRVNSPTRVHISSKEAVNVTGWRKTSTPESLPASNNFREVDGRAVVTFIQLHPGGIAVRVFNPHESEERVVVRSHYGDPSIVRVTLAGTADPQVTVTTTDEQPAMIIPAKRIATLLVVRKRLDGRTQVQDNCATGGG